tara:strand:- start:416 stop:829 length:414 start_codon:yes stop_codon:yes gene_type:complete
MIRKLQITDYPKIINLLAQLTQTPPISRELYQKQFNKLNVNDLHLVIEKEGEIIGYGSIIIDFKFYRNCKNIGHIEDIVIDNKQRGKGYAKIIMNNLIDYGLKQNCYKFILNCKDEFIEFYKKYNFVKFNNNMIKYI